MEIWIKSPDFEITIESSWVILGYINYLSAVERQVHI
jgi:hypothetical protein